MKSVMNHQFGQTPNVAIQRSAFNRSHGHKTTFDADYLIPIYVDEALPGDTFNLKMTAFARLSTQIKPVMDNLYMDSFFFAVPIRLIWENWEKFCGAQDDPGDSTVYTVPVMEAPAVTGHLIDSLSDHFGIPTGIAELEHNSLHHRAYVKIWCDWFRDENLQDSSPYIHAGWNGDGPDDPADYPLLKRGKRHDYFTSCLPWPQKATSVKIPMADTPIIGDGTAIYVHGTTQADKTLGFANGSTNVQFSAVAGNTEDVYFGKTVGSTNTGLTLDGDSTIAATINELRQAVQIQRLYEKDARGGTRYIEVIKSHFGVTSPDFRMQRSEYLGGGSNPIHINPIAQTSVTTATTPQGNLAGMGTCSFSNGFIKSFTEHCVLIGMVSVRADLTYQDGLDRMMSRQTRWDYYWPTLANIGEQAVLTKEITCGGAAGGWDDDVFGYQERYAEYRYKPSKITGLFRSSAAGSIDIWHCAYDWQGQQAFFQASFIESDTHDSLQRIKAVNTEPDFIFDSYFDLNCVRPMPVYSVPGLMDHF